MPTTFVRMTEVTTVRVMTTKEVSQVCDDMYTGRKKRIPSLGSSWDSLASSTKSMRMEMSSLGSGVQMNEELEGVTLGVANVNLMAKPLEDVKPVGKPDDTKPPVDTKPDDTKPSADGVKPDAAEPLEDTKPDDWWGWKWTLHFVLDADDGTEWVYWTKEEMTSEEITAKFQHWSYLVVRPKEGCNAGIYSDYEEACNATCEGYHPRCFDAEGNRDSQQDAVNWLCNQARNEDAAKEDDAMYD